VTGKERRNGGKVLREPRDKVEELKMPRNPEGSGGVSDLGAAGGLSRSEKGGLELAEGPPRAGIGRVDPARCQCGGELRALSDPLRNTRKTGKTGSEGMEGEGNREVIRETRAGGREGAIVGGMEEDGDVSGDKGVVEERGGDKEAVEPGGPGMG